MFRSVDASLKTRIVMLYNDPLLFTSIRLLLSTSEDLWFTAEPTTFEPTTFEQVSVICAKVKPHILLLEGGHGFAS